jgi:lysozyme
VVCVACRCVFLLHCGCAVLYSGAAVNLSRVGLNLIEGFESCRLIAYTDSGGKWTIGWGYTGPDVHAGLVWTQAQADAALFARTAIAEHVVNIGVRVNLMQCRFDALCSLTYNIGGRAFLNSSLLRYLNLQDWAAASEQFMVWDMVDGKQSADLLQRRTVERAFFDLAG